MSAENVIYEKLREGYCLSTTETRTEADEFLREHASLAVEALRADPAALADLYIEGLAAVWKARAEKAEQERDQFRSQAALFQRRVAQLERPMTTVDEDGRVWRLVPATRTNVDEWPWQDPEDPIVLFRRLPLEDGE